MRIAVPRTFEPKSVRNQVIEDSDFLENLDGVVLNLNSGSKFPDLGRLFVHTNSPSPSGQHDGGAQPANPSPDDFRMPSHDVTRPSGENSSGPIDLTLSSTPQTPRHGTRPCCHTHMPAPIRFVW